VKPPPSGALITVVFRERKDAENCAAVRAVGEFGASVPDNKLRERRDRACFSGPRLLVDPLPASRTREKVSELGHRRSLTDPFAPKVPIHGDRASSSPQLPLTLALHAPQCPARRGLQCHCDRIDDVYAFCQALVNDHLAVGARRANGSFTGPCHLTRVQVDDIVQDMVSVAWAASERFNGNGRLSGWVVFKVTKGITDWRRHEFGSTRYGPRPLVESADEIELSSDLGDLTAAEVRDLVNGEDLSRQSRRTLERVALPMALDGASLEDYAERSGKPLGQVKRELGALARELEEAGVLVA
jgi:DNA-directed RNA polymerase specialized sigma24 family protein